MKNNEKLVVMVDSAIEAGVNLTLLEDEFRAVVMERALSSARGNQTNAAKLCGQNRGTFRKECFRLRIRHDNYLVVERHVEGGLTWFPDCTDSYTAFYSSVDHPGGGVIDLTISEIQANGEYVGKATLHGRELRQTKNRSLKIVMKSLSIASDNALRGYHE
jgi:hypothetical protein